MKHLGNWTSYEKTAGGLNVCPELCVDPVHLATSSPCMSHPPPSNSILIHWINGSAEKLSIVVETINPLRGSVAEGQMGTFLLWNE